MEAHGATVEIGFPLKSECQKRGDLSFYAYYTLWRNDRMPMYVVSCTSPKPDGKEHVEAAFSYFQKNKYPPTVRYDEASLVSPSLKFHGSDKDNLLNLSNFMSDLSVH